MMLKIAGVVLCEILIFTVLRQIKPEFVIISQVASVVVLLFMIGDELKNSLEAVNMFFENTDGASQFLPVLFKVLGISLITQFISEMCKDAGESALSVKVEFAGKVMIAAAGIPVIKGFTGFVAELISGV